MSMLVARVDSLMRSSLPQNSILPLVLVVVSLSAGSFVADPVRVRAAFAGAALLVLVAIGLAAPRPLLFTLAIWLTCLSLVRRLLTGVSSGGAADPLLLVAPLALLTLTLVAQGRGAFARPTPLGKVVLVYTGLVLLGALNPLQGNLFAGLSGLIFFVPLAAFWVGGALCDDATLRRLFQLIAVLALPAAAYALYQTFVGFPSWDVRWIRAVDFTSLNVGDAKRPFSVFASSAESATFLAIGFGIWIAFVRRRALVVPALAALALLGTAIVFHSSRGTVVSLIATLALLPGVRRGLPLWAGLIVGVALLLMVPVAADVIAPSIVGDGAPSQLLTHQVQGLANPLDPESSTVSAHVSLMINGIKSAFRDPLGHGIAAVTIAGKKFGGLQYGTEADPSNAAVALGLPGLVAYLAFLAIAYARVYRVAAVRRDPLAVAVLAVVTLTFLQWFNGGQYAVAWLPWLAFGWADVAYERLRSNPA
jgi:hypothetical protein